MAAFHDIGTIHREETVSIGNQPTTQCPKCGPAAPQMQFVPDQRRYFCGVCSHWSDPVKTQAPPPDPRNPACTCGGPTRLDMVRGMYYCDSCQRHLGDGAAQAIAQHKKKQANKFGVGAWAGISGFAVFAALVTWLLVVRDPLDTDQARLVDKQPVHAGADVDAGLSEHASKGEAEELCFKKKRKDACEVLIKKLVSSWKAGKKVTWREFNKIRGHMCLNMGSSLDCYITASDAETHFRKLRPKPIPVRDFQRLTFFYRKACTYWYVASKRTRDERMLMNKACKKAEQFESQLKQAGHGKPHP